MDPAFWAALSAVGTLLTAIITAVYTFFTGKMVRRDLGEKLYIKCKYKDTNNHYDKSVNYGIGLPEDYERVGFVSELADKLILFNIHNNGVSPASNITLKYTIIVYRHQIEFEKDTGMIDVDRSKLVEYKTFTRKIILDYIPPNDYIVERVMFTDYFPKVKIKVGLLKSNSYKFIKKETNIAEYYHPLFDRLGDSRDTRLLLGEKWIEKDEGQFIF